MNQGISGFQSTERKLRLEWGAVCPKPKASDKARKDQGPVDRNPDSGAAGTVLRTMPGKGL